MINYKIGDEIVSKLNPTKVIGKCTGFTDDGCVLIDGKVWGGKIYFMKSEFVEFEILR